MKLPTVSALFIASLGFISCEKSKQAEEAKAPAKEKESARNAPGKPSKQAANPAVEAAHQIGKKLKKSASQSNELLDQNKQ